jgi:HK97 family phage portal protein
VGILLGTEKRSWIPEPPISPILGANPWGTVTVSTKPDLALTLAPVWSAVGLLANTISSLPLQTFRNSSDGTPVRMTDPALVRAPDTSMIQARWVHAVMVSLLLRGNAYGRITLRDTALRPTQMMLINPDLLDVKQDEDTGVVTYKVKKTQREIPRDDIWHLPGLTMPGAAVGLSPISYAAATMGIELGARQFAAEFFAGGGIPKAVLESDMPVDQAQAKTLKERLMGAFRAREPIVLGAGVRYTPISVKPEESQFLATQQATATDIARFFWIPADMIDAPSGKSMTYANREQRSLDFLVYSVAHWLKRIEDSISLLLPQPQFAKFDVQELLRTDVETQAKVDLQYLAGKVLAPSEIRQRIGKPPMTDEQKQEANLVPLTPTATGGVRLPQAAAAIPPGAEAPVPKSDQQTGGPNG